jgi:hypothetical protein
MVEAPELQSGSAAFQGGASRTRSLAGFSPGPALSGTANPDKYADELLDAYPFVEDADALYAEYAARGVEFTRGLGNMPHPLGAG